MDFWINGIIGFLSFEPSSLFLPFHLSSPNIPRGGDERHTSFEVFSLKRFCFLLQPIVYLDRRTKHEQRAPGAETI